jgi:hypothetical protein
MLKNGLLMLLTALGSALSWLPISVQPGLDLSAWIPVATAALCAGLSALLSRTWWPLFLAASGSGTFAGICLSYKIWWPSDPIAATWVPYSVAGNTLIVVLVSLAACLAARKTFMFDGRWRRVTWAVLSGCVAFGPVALAMTPTLVAHRIAKNDRMAAERFACLKRAVERATAESKEPTRLCDGAALKYYYSGPSFSNQDWRRITGNYVKQDGYFFMVHCRETGGYAIDVLPARQLVDGTVRFCTDESRKIACRLEWNGSRYQCSSCQN